MQNQNDDGSKNDDQDFDEEIYDDGLEENFDEDFDDSDFLDMELEDEDGDVGLDEYEVSDAEQEDLGEWDEGAEDDAEYAELGAAAIQKKKRRINMSFNAMAITGAVIVGLCVLGYQVATSKPKFTGDNFKSDLKLSGASDGPIFGDKNVQSTEIVIPSDGSGDAEKGFLENPELLDTMDGTVGDTASTAISDEQKPDIVSDEPVPRPPEDIAANEFLNRPVPEAVPMPAAPVVPVVTPPTEQTPPPAMPSAMDILKSNVAKREATKNQQPEKMAEQKPNIEDVIVPLPVAPKVVEVKKEEKKIVAAEPVKEPSQTVVVQKVEMNAELENKLDTIINRLDDMEMQITQVREAGNSKIEDISENVDSLKQEVSKIASTPSRPAPVKQTMADIEEPAPVQKAAPKKAPVKKAAPAKPSWELRAAQPGRAWVSKKGQKDMQPVVVGDTLNGVGRITSINFDGSRWVVQGTSGRIIQ